MFFTKKGDDARFYMRTAKTLKPSRPAFPQFSGKVYILVNGGTYSTGADFVSLMKSYQLATFIGEEAGGAGAQPAAEQLRRAAEEVRRGREQDRQAQVGI